MKDPAFLFYSSDFLSGTMLMSNEDVGKYIRLLCLQHQKGHLKEKDMLNICGIFNEDVFCKFKKDEEGNYYNERLEYESNKRKAYSESRRNNRNKVDNTNTCIYLIKDILTGLTKIGSSNKPERRLFELKNQYENENLTLIAYAENVEQKLETELHIKYKEKNKINEWFDLSDKDIKDIININHMKLHMINHMYKHMENENENVNENININKIKNKDNRGMGKEGKSKKTFEEVFNENQFSEELETTIKDFMDMRKTMKKPMTVKALELLIKNLKKLTNLEEEQIAILNQSIEHSWQTVYPLKQLKNNTTDGNINDFKQLWEEAKKEDEQTGNNTSNNPFSW